MASLEPDKRIKDVIFKKCAPFRKCKTDADISPVDNAKDLDVVMPIYNLTEYSKN